LSAMKETLKAFPEYPLYEIGQVVAGEREVKLCA
jgi:hypothetical protein